jgi:hypothetical protein
MAGKGRWNAAQGDDRRAEGKASEGREAMPVEDSEADGT